MVGSNERQQVRDVFILGRIGKHILDAVLLQLQVLLRHNLGVVMAQFPVHGKVPRTKQRHYFFALVLDSLFVLHTEVIDSNDGLRI